MELDTLGEITHKINTKEHIFIKIKTQNLCVLHYLPMGSNLKIEEVKSGWAKLFFC